MELYNKIQETIKVIRKQTNLNPKIGIVLGTGLGPLAEAIIPEIEIPFNLLPHFPTPTVIGHEGKMVFGKIEEVEVILLAGRFHYYEGYSMQEVTFPIRVLGQLGVEQLILSNVAGGLQEDLFPGDFIFLKDHINLQPANPLRGTNDERLGPRFPDMMYTYDREANKKALAICEKKGFKAREGVYVSLAGPNLETPAEYNFLHIIGGDVVGMSTVPEVLVARHQGMKIFAISIVSNKCYPIEDLTPTSVEEVVAVANEASERVKVLMRALIPELAQE